MPLNAANFVLMNPTPERVAKLNLALAYLDSAGGDIPSKLSAMAATGKPIVFNDIGVTSTASNLSYINWDPSAALAVVDNNGQKIGVQSPALGLLHEIGHVLDPNAVVNRQISDAQYGNKAERIATELENVAAVALGETPRPNNNDDGKPKAPNPTEHTEPQQDALKHWVLFDENGNEVIGPVWSPTDSAGPSFGGTGDGCVAVSSFLPGDLLAGDVTVGSELELCDENSLERGIGIVSYSEKKLAKGFRISTEGGASLLCSETAPIPAKDEGLLHPADLLGKFVLVRYDTIDGTALIKWEEVVLVEPAGEFYVQHITVGDRCFWAGERKGAYVLHHNLKMGGGGGDPDENPLVAQEPYATISLIGIPPSHVG